MILVLSCTVRTYHNFQGILRIEFQTVLPDTMNVKPIIHDLNEQKTATITYWCLNTLWKWTCTWTPYLSISQSFCHPIRWSPDLSVHLLHLQLNCLTLKYIANILFELTEAFSTYQIVLFSLTIIRLTICSSYISYSIFL